MQTPQLVPDPQQCARDPYSGGVKCPTHILPGTGVPPGTTDWLFVAAVLFSVAVVALCISAGVKIWRSRRG